MKKLFLLLVILLSTLACLYGEGMGPVALPPDEDFGVPLPPNEDYGVMCFMEYQYGIVAGAPVFESFYSQDGGLTWRLGLEDGTITGSGCFNKRLTSEIWVTPDGQTRYRFHPGKRIEVSTDKGQSWEMAYDLTQVQWEPVYPPDEAREVIVQPGPLDSMIDPFSGNLLLAMGHAGVLVRLPSGEWRWVEVGQYANAAIDFSSTGQETVDEEPQLPSWIQVTPNFEVDTQTNYVDAMAFSPNGAVLAVSGFDGGVKLYDFPQADLLYRHSFGKNDRNWRLYGLAFSPDGRTLVTCGTNVDQTLNIWNTESWELIKSFTGFQTNTLGTGGHAGRQYLAIAFGADPQNKDQVRLFQLPEGVELDIFNSQLGGVSSLYFIPETPLLAVARYTGLLEVWDIEKGERMPFPESYITVLGYDPSKDVLMGFLPNGRLTAWDMSTVNLAWELALPIPRGWNVNTAAFSPNGNLVAVGMHNGPLLIFNTHSGALLTRQWITDGGTLQQLAFSPDNHWIAAGFTTGMVRIWQVKHLISQD